MTSAKIQHTSTGPSSSWSSRVGCDALRQIPNKSWFWPMFSLAIEQAAPTQVVLGMRRRKGSRLQLCVEALRIHQPWIEKMAQKCWSTRSVAEWLGFPCHVFEKAYKEEQLTIPRKLEVGPERMHESPVQYRKRLIKEGARRFLLANSERCVTIREIVAEINGLFNSLNIKRTYYSETRRCLIRDLGYKYKRVCQRPQKSFDPALESGRKLFARMLELCQSWGYKVLFLDECSINTGRLPKMTWTLAGTKKQRISRPTNQSWNVIAAKWGDYHYWWVKKGTTKSTDFLKFAEELHTAVEKRLEGDDDLSRIVWVMDNASVHKTKEVRSLFVELGIRAFTLPPYSPELNRIENTFGNLKVRLSRELINEKSIVRSVCAAIPLTAPGSSVVT